MTTKTPRFRCRSRFILTILGIGVAMWAVCWFLRVQTIQDLYLTGGMAINGPPIWKGIALRSIAAGDSVNTITNRHSPTHSSTLGHYTIFCYHRRPWNVSLISKDGVAVYASADHFDQIKVYFDSMTPADNAELEKEKLENHQRMTSGEEDSASKSAEDTSLRADPQR